ncbi:MAG: ABC transporter permease [Pseudomonadota bacterium]|nr:ABC transporter permease [Pseudomonadota bacterium]
MGDNLRGLARDLWFLPKLRVGAFNVWSHYFLVFRQAPLINFFWVSVEPLVYLFAIGNGVGSLVAEVNGVSYFEFFFPGLLAISVMITTSYETTYGTYNRAYFSKTFANLFLTPISSMDLLLGEILWAVFKGLLSALTVVLVLYVDKYLSLGQLFSLLGASVLLCWFFSSLGLFITSIVGSSESFIYYQSGFLIPMAMLCNTYFPMTNYPETVQALIKILPLSQGVFLFRAIMEGRFELSFYLAVLYFLILSFLFTNWSLQRMSKKIETLV